MMTTYLRSFEQALPEISAGKRQLEEVARKIIGAGEIVVRDLTPGDLGLQDFVVSAAAGINANALVSNYQVPTAKAILIYGILVEPEPSGVYALYADIYIGGSRVRRIDLNKVRDGSNNGRVIYLPLSEQLIVKEQNTISIQVAVNNTGNAAANVRVDILGFVAEPNGVTIMRK